MSQKRPFLRQKLTLFVAFVLFVERLGLQLYRLSFFSPSLLVQEVTKMNEPTIFLLESDDDTRPLFRRLLKENGYNVLLAVDEEDALQKVNDGFVKSDLLIVNLLGKSEEEMLDFGNLMRDKGKSNIPVLAIAAEYGEDLEGAIIKVRENEYIVYLDDATELFDLLSSLTKTKPS